MKKYTTIFFDLDRTLWDFEANAAKAFEAMFEQLELHKYGIPNYIDFYEKYAYHNKILWDLYNRGEMKKEVLKAMRFRLALADYNVSNDLLAVYLSDAYLDNSLKFNVLFPGAKEILIYLHDKFKLGIITNGFEEIQHEKLRISGLGKYFNAIITSEEAEYKKPDSRIFQYALRKIKSSAEESIMVGDDEKIDLEGAKKVGISQIFFNPEKKLAEYESTYEIQSLLELKSIF